jgi:putative ABC transport system permease protein
MVIQNANSSNIVVAQKAAGITNNVLTGTPFEQRQSGTTTLSPEYQLEYALYSFGSFERITTLYYFTKDFESRKNISNYFEKYVSDDEVDFGTLTYNDYLERAALQFDGAIKMMTNVLYVFAAISVFVSAILNAILTYISIHQRTNEIGLLRSLGARKKDIGIMVETESLLCGLFGGVLSIILAASFVYPVNQMLTRAIYQYNFYILAKTTFTLPGFQWWVAPIMLGLGIATALISALIPAIIASKKDPAHAINE